MFKKKNNVNYLELTPEHNHEFKSEDEIVKVLIPKFKSEFMQKFIPKHKSKHITIKLDELGTAVWRKIDGNRTVGLIVNELTKELGDKIQPAQERVLKFFTQMYQYKFILFKELKRKK